MECQNGVNKCYKDEAYWQAGRNLEEGMEAGHDFAVEYGIVSPREELFGRVEGRARYLDTLSCFWNDDSPLFLSKLSRIGRDYFEVN